MLDRNHCQIKDFYDTPSWDDRNYGGGQSFMPPDFKPTAEGKEGAGKTGPEKDKSTADTSQNGKIHPLRQSILADIKEMDGHVVGDKEFDPVITKDGWKAMKDAEQKDRDDNAAKKKAYKEQMGAYEVGMGPKPEKPILKVVKNYTTCCDTQIRLLQRAFEATGLDIKEGGIAKGQETNYGTPGKDHAKKLNIWNPASPNMADRPTPADIFILSKRGKSVDNAISSLSYHQNMGGQGKKVRSLEAQLAQLKAKRPEHLEGAKQIAQDNKESALAKRLANAQAQYDKYEKFLTENIKKAKEKMASNPDTLQFSHVGFVVKIEDLKDEHGENTGKELWTTFDGGQTINGKQGAKKSERIYDPATNEITGERSQGGDDRWLAGWIKIEDMVKEKTEGTGG